MTRYIVTGSGGHIGNTLVRTLIKTGKECVPLVRKKNNPALSDLGIEETIGNIDDEISLTSLLSPDDIVLHCAGRIEITGRDRDAVFDTNLTGTRNVLRACEKKGARLVYVSSVDVFSKPETGSVSEPLVIDPASMKSNYAISKGMATNEVLKSAKEGLCDASVVYPSAVIGPYDYKVSNVGQVIDDFIRGLPMARINGGYNFVDVRDVASGIISCAEKGISGRDYLLTGEYCSVDRLFEILGSYCGRKMPLHLPLWFVSMFSDLGILYYQVRGKKPVFSRYALKTLNSNCNYDCSRASEELGYTHRGCEESLLDSAKWFSDNRKKRN